MDFLTDTAGFLDLLFCVFREIFGTDNKWDLWKVTTTENFEETVLNTIDDGNCFALLSTFSFDSNIFGNEGPKLINIDAWFPFAVLKKMEMSHTNFAEVTGVIAIKPSSLVCHTTGITMTTGGLAVLTNTAITHRFLAAKFSALTETCGHEKRWGQNRKK